MRLATFNILHGRSPADDRVDADRFAAAVAALDADVLALQEVDRAQPRSHRLDLTAVAAEAMGAVAWRFVPAVTGGIPTPLPPGPGTEDAGYGIALLSRYPVSRWDEVVLPRVALAVPTRPRGLRPATRVEEPRMAVVAELDTPDGALVVAATHLSFLPGWGRTQLALLRRRLRRIGAPTVILGDFNLTRIGPRRLTGFGSLAHHPTFPADRPQRQIDHILLRQPRSGPRARVEATDAPRLPLSDHRALVADLSWH